jgi:hypothetical protein
MQRWAWFDLALSAFLAIGAAGCGDDQDPQGAGDLWTRIHEARYAEWMRAPGYATRRETEAPHADEVEIFVNDVVASALGGGAITSWPEGSIIVKDGYDGDELEIVAAMEKRGGAWFWVEWDASGDPAYSGNPSICTGCHESGADGVRAFGFPHE